MSTNNQSHYQILGVNSTAGLSEIKAAYRRLAKEFHPDKNNGEKFYEEYFKMIARAYECLSDPIKRKQYDRKLAYGRIGFNPKARKTRSKKKPFDIWITVYPKEIIVNKPFKIIYTVNARNLSLIEGEAEGLRLVSKEVRKTSKYVMSFICTYVSDRVGDIIMPESFFIDVDGNTTKIRKQKVRVQEKSLLKRRFIKPISYNMFALLVCISFIWIVVLFFYDHGGALININDQPSKEVSLNARSNFVEGSKLSELKQYEKAIEYQTRAITIDPDYCSAYWARGNARSKLGDFKEAIKDFTFSANLCNNSDKDIIFNNRGLCYRSIGLYDKAIEDFSRAIKFDSANEGYWFNRAYVKYFNLGDFKGAISDLTNAIDLDSENATFYHVRGLAYFYKESYSKSIEDINKAIELNPDNAQYYYNIGDAMEQLDMTQQACINWTRAKDLGYNVPSEKVGGCEENL